MNEWICSFASGNTNVNWIKMVDMASTSCSYKKIPVRNFASFLSEVKHNSEGYFIL